MTFDPEVHHRRSIRLKGWDYSWPGAYYVTICLQDRASLFGEIVDGNVRLNPAGQMVRQWWLELKHKFPAVEVDEHVVMPNHFHGIVIIVESARGGDSEPLHGSEAADGVRRDTGHPRRGAPTLGDVIDWFKTMTTNEYIRGVKQRGWKRFAGRFWQRDYYEHIIRTEEELYSIRSYIAANPLRWAMDRENPGATSLAPPERWEPPAS